VYNDCWGYTAPDGREYALLGVRTGTSIVDITETGATLAANQLRILTDGEILASEAVLAGSLAAQWSAAGIEALRKLCGALLPRSGESAGLDGFLAELRTRG